MARLKGKLDELKQELIVLKHTRKINEDDLKLPEWFELSQDYAEVTESTDKAIISIKNSILFQRRLVFCLTRDFTRELVKTDKNWKKAGLDNNAWTTILAKLVKSGLVELVREGKYKVPAVYKVVDADIRKVLQVNEEQQLSESVEFAKKFESDRKADNKPDNKPDDKADAVCSSKKIVYNSTQEIKKSNENTETVLADRESKNSVSSGQTKVIDIEHKALLDTALSVPEKNLNSFEIDFLKNKPEQLQQYGNFKVKQLDILKKIAAKAATKTDKPGLTEAAVKAITQSDKTASEIYNKIQDYSFKADKFFNFILTLQNLPETELNALAGLLGLSNDSTLAESIKTAGQAYTDLQDSRQRLKLQYELKQELFSLSNKDLESVTAIIQKYTNQLRPGNIKAAMQDSFVSQSVITQLTT